MLQNASSVAASTTQVSESITTVLAHPVTASRVHAVVQSMLSNVNNNPALSNALSTLPTDLQEVLKRRAACSCVVGRVHVLVLQLLSLLNSANVLSIT